MSKLEIFNNDEFGQMRTIKDRGEIWFVSKDVCSALDIKNTSDAVSRLAVDEKGIDSIDTPGGKQEMSVVNEFGLYNLVLGSRKEEAKKFKRWITHEVIPQIRKTGSYSASEPQDDLSVALQLNQQVGTALKEIQQQKEEVAAVKGDIEELKDKIDVRKEHDDVTASDIARRLGITTVNGTAHNQLVGAIAKKLDMKNNYKHRYQDEDVKILPRAEGGFQVYYKPVAAEKIHNWFEEHKDAIYYEKRYSRGGKYGNKGDLKEKGYTVRGTNYKVWSARESKEVM